MGVSEVKKKEFTLDEIKKHTTAEDCWLIIGNESNGACGRACKNLCGEEMQSIGHWLQFHQEERHCFLTDSCMGAG